MSNEPDNFNYYIVSPHNISVYNFVDVSPQPKAKNKFASESKDYKVSKRYSRFVRYRGQYFAPSPWARFDIFNNKLRNTPAYPSKNKYIDYKEKIFGDINISEIAEKVAYGTSAIGLKDFDYHLSEIIHDYERGFYPWFYPVKSHGINKLFGSFGNDYLIIKSEDKLDFKQHSRVTRSPQEYFQSNGFEIASLNVDWGSIPLKDRVNNLFSRSWFSTVFSGPYSDFSGTYHISEKLFGDQSNPDNTQFEFYIVDEIGDLDSYKQWVKENFSPKLHSKIEEDYRWKKENIPSLQKASIQQLTLAQNVRNPNFASAFLGRSEYNPEQCRSKWEEVTDGSWTCSDGFAYHTCDIERKDIVTASDSEQISIKLDAESETVKIPGSITVQKRSGDEVEVSLTKLQEGENESDCQLLLQEIYDIARDTNDIYEGIVPFFGKISSLDPASDGKIDLEAPYIKLDDSIGRAKGYVKLGSLSVGELKERAISVAWCNAQKEAEEKAKENGTYDQARPPSPWSYYYEHLKSLLAQIKEIYNNSAKIYLEELMSPDSKDGLYTQASIRTIGDYDHNYGAIDQRQEALFLEENLIDPTSLIKEHSQKTIIQNNPSINNSKISVGENFTMLVKSDGTLWASGDNSSGQLGLGQDFGNQLEFTQVDTSAMGSGNIKSVFCGSNHHLVLKEDGTLWGVGKNDFGQIGPKVEGDIYWDYVALHHFMGEGNVVSASASSDASYFIKDDASLWAQGNNSFGQVNPYSNDSFITSPYKITSNVSQVSGGEECCAYIKENNLYGLGRLSISRSKEKLIDGSVDRVCLGKKHLCYIKNGSVFGLGYNKHFQLNNYPLSVNSFYNYKPELILPIGSFDSSAFDDVVSSSNSDSTLILSNKGNVLFLGKSQFGLSRKNVSPGASFTGLACGSNHSAFIDTYNNVYTHGFNSFGEIGNGSLSSEPKLSIQIQDSSFDPALHNLSPEDYSSNIISYFDRKLFFIENNKLKYLSDNSGNSSEIVLDGDVKEIFSGGFGAFAISRHGNLNKIFKLTEPNSDNLSEKVDTYQTDSPDSRFRYYNPQGKLFEGVSSHNGQLFFSENSFENVEEKNSIVFNFNDSQDSLAVEFYYKIKANQKIRFLNSNGETYETTIPQSSGSGVFSKISKKFSFDINSSKIFETEEDITDLSVGSEHLLFTLSKGSLMGYGKNSFGELGDGTLNQSTSPKVLADNAILCSAGNNNSLFVRRVGDEDLFYGCGDNTVGQLGISSRDFSKSYSHQNKEGSPLRSSQEPLPPFKEPTLITRVNLRGEGGIKNISCGDLNSAYITGSGKVYIAGHNNKGQLGLTNPSSNLDKPSGFNARINRFSKFTDAKQYTSFEECSPIDFVNTFQKSIKKIVCQKDYTLFLTKDNELWGCGLNYNAYFSGSQRNISGALGYFNRLTFHPQKIISNVVNFTSFDNTTALIDSKLNTITLSGNGILDFSKIDFNNLANEQENLDDSFNLGFLNIFNDSSSLDFSYLSEAYLKEEAEDPETKSLDDMMTSEASLDSEENNLFKYLNEENDSKFEFESKASYAFGVDQWQGKIIEPGDYEKIIVFYENITAVQNKGTSWRDYGPGAVACFSSTDESYAEFWQARVGNKDAAFANQPIQKIGDCPDPPPSWGEGTPPSTSISYDGQNLKPYISKKSDDYSWECARGVYGDTFAGTPTKTPQPSKIVVSCNYFTDRYGKSYNYRKVLSPGGVATIALDDGSSNMPGLEGNVYPNAGIVIEYLREGSAIISASTTDEDCSNYNYSGVTSEAASKSDWNKGEASCPLPGCTDSTACNYDDTASCNDGSCDYSCYGCMASDACNYDSSATKDCDSTASSNSKISCTPCDYSSCKGCTSSNACNYDPAATIDDGTCEYSSCTGCMDQSACNYDPSATKNGGCDYSSCAPSTAVSTQYYKYVNCDDSSDVIYLDSDQGSHIIKK